MKVGRRRGLAHAASAMLRRRRVGRGLRFGARLAGTALVLAVVILLVLDRIAPFPLARLDDRVVSSVVTDRSGRILSATVGADEQWRRPVGLAEISPHLVAATIAIEDERYRVHPGVDPIAVLRAALHNGSARRVVSGASTITMQVARMVEPRARTVTAKAIEAFRALQLERLRTKDEILESYLNLAPYGGNVRGVEAAAAHWFGTAAAELSLADAALLAGLPQSPERLRPDRFPAAARARRNRVLERMEALRLITPTAARVARATDVRLAPRVQHDDLAPHAAALARGSRPSGGRLALDARIQRAALDAVRAARRDLPADADIAVVVLEIASSAVRAWIGSADPDDSRDGQVDGARARRSPGSALKPFIYLAAFDSGRLGPDSLVPDRPLARDGWAPRNFDRTYAGTRTARDALRASANVPAILVAEALGVHRCAGFLQAAGVSLPPGAPERAGLALAVGATEVRLVDLVNANATLGRGGIARPWTLFADDRADAGVRVASAAACRLVDDALARTDLPAGAWAMWKTGTSAGHRDAWAVGHNGRFAAGVWVGRFSGVGDLAFTGAEAAAPILADVFTRPSVRVTAAPPPPERSAPVRRPFVFETPDELRITDPVDGAIYHPVRGEVRIRPRVQAGDESGDDVSAGLTWFLDGRRLVPAEMRPLNPSPGAHELRCVGATGTWSAVRFVVHP